MLAFQIALALTDFFILLGVGAVFASMVAMLYSAHLDVPFADTPRETFQKIFDALKIQSGDVVYELGSGDGRFLLAAAKQFPDARFVGLELNPLLYMYSLIQKKMRGNPVNVEFRKKNFFETDLSEATKLYAYLLTPVMQRLYPKLQREAKNALIASRAFKFSQAQPLETIEISKKIGSHGEHLLYLYDLTDSCK